MSDRPWKETMRRFGLREKISQAVLERPWLNRKLLQTKESFEQVKEILSGNEKKKS